MPEQTKEICSTCRYFRPLDVATGACHRYPPVFAGDSSPREQHHWRHPVVGPHGWCGEFYPAGDNQMSSSGVTS